MSRNKKEKNYKLFKPINDLTKPKEYINKIIKKDIIMYSVLVFSLILLTSTSTYAYVSTEVDTIQLQNVVSSNIEGVEVINNNINIENLDINSNYMYEFTVDNNNTEVAKNITYYLKINNNTFSNLKFKVYEGTKDTVSSKTPLYTSNKLNPNIKEIEITGLNKNIKANTTQTYTIVFDIEKVDNQEIYDAYKDFSANIFIDLKVSGNLGE